MSGSYLDGLLNLLFTASSNSSFSLFDRWPHRIPTQWRVDVGSLEHQEQPYILERRQGGSGGCPPSKNFVTSPADVPPYYSFVGSVVLLDTSIFIATVSHSVVPLCPFRKYMRCHFAKTNTSIFVRRWGGSNDFCQSGFYFHYRNVKFYTMLPLPNLNFNM